MTNTIWFHLNSQPDLFSVLPAATGASIKPGEIRIRVPKESFGETPIERLCIAPTVWQCCIGAPPIATLTIYEVELRSAPTPADESVDDRDITSEAWITQTELDAHGGDLGIRAIGRTTVDKDTKLSLKIGAKQKRLPLSHSEERETVWDIQDGDWLLRDDQR